MSATELDLKGMVVSWNGKLLLEPYKSSGKIRINTSGGFAKIEQKSNLIGLKLLANARICYGPKDWLLYKGAMVFFEEEVLHTSAWAKKTYNCSEFDEKFIVADIGNAIMVVPE